MEDEAIAILFSFDPAHPDEGANWDVFSESDDTSSDLDPITRADLLMESCRPDFPSTRLWSFTGNERARKLRGDYLTKRLLGEN